MEVYSIFYELMRIMLNKNEIRERLIIARKALPGKISPRKFAMGANVDVSQYTKYEKHSGPLGSEKILELCSTWGINTEWLQTGKGDIFVGQQAGKEIVFGEEKPDSKDYRAELKETKDDLREARRKIDAHVDYLQDLLKTSLVKLIEGQAGGLAILLEVLELDIRQEAGGNADKVKEIRAEIARRISPKLSADLQADIAHDGRN